MIHLRKRDPVFGRGSLSFIKPANRKVFVFSRSYLDETVLCVFNLSQSAQPVELDLQQFEGCVDLNPAQYLITARYIEGLKEMAKSENTKVIFMPVQTSRVLESARTIREILSGMEETT